MEEHKAKLSKGALARRGNVRHVHVYFECSCGARFMQHVSVNTKPKEVVVTEAGCVARDVKVVTQGRQSDDCPAARFVVRGNDWALGGELTWDEAGDVLRGNGG